MMDSSLNFDGLPWLIRVFAFWFGAIWGSFFNVAIYRWPRGISVVSPASRCPNCDAPIAPYRNIPILSYFLLRGRASCCGAKISARYPLVEAMGALLCLALTETFVLCGAESVPLVERVVVTLSYFAFGGGLIIATFIDLEFMEIPDEISLPITALGLATAAFRDPPGVEAAALGAGAGFLVVQVLFVWVYERLTGRRGMGEGDAKLLMAIGAFVGWRGGIFSLLGGAAQGLLLAVPILLLRKPSSRDPEAAGDPVQREINRSEIETTSPAETSDERLENSGDEPPRYFGHIKIPFGPFLALGAMEYLFFGERLVELYLALGEKLTALFSAAL
jgi:leader peptidase (prepilin peptidase) / N-methyltransferase